MSFASMLHGLSREKVRFVVIGGVAAAAHGSRRVTDDLDVCYDASSQNVFRLAALLSSWNAYPRGIEAGLPFFIDARQFRTTATMTLSTNEGSIDVLDRVAGVGGYSECKAQSMPVKAFDLSLRILTLPALIAAKQAAGRPKDIDQLPELEALLALTR